VPENIDIPLGTRALIFSKLYFGVLSKSLEELEIERYFSVLYFLKENNGCSQQYICNHLAIDKTAMVKIMDYLIKADYVTRNVNPQDRREHFIILTKKGQKRTEEIVESFDTIDEHLFASISKSDRTTFEKVLKLLSENLKALPGNDLFFNYKKTHKPRRKKEIANRGISPVKANKRKKQSIEN